MQQDLVLKELDFDLLTPPPGSAGVGEGWERGWGIRHEEGDSHLMNLNQ